MRINYLKLGRIRKDFVPFIPEVTQLALRRAICKDMYGNNLSESYKCSLNNLTSVALIDA